MNFDGYKEEEGNGIGITLERVGKTLRCVFIMAGPSEGSVYFLVSLCLFSAVPGLCGGAGSSRWYGVLVVAPGLRSHDKLA